MADRVGSGLSRRKILQLGGLIATGLTLGQWDPARAQRGVTARRDAPSAEEALQLLMEGNRRWADGRPQRPNQDVDRRMALAGGQAPFAVVFSCVDSRVPPEIVFDQGLGDLFVIRTAGHVIDNAALGSIEFGVEELHIPLVVVMGHERCGAVAATVEAVEHGSEAPGRINTLVNGIRPAVETTREWPGDRVDNAVRANVVATVEALRHTGPILEEMAAQQRAMIVGGRYDLATGMVDLIA